MIVYIRHDADIIARIIMGDITVRQIKIRAGLKANRCLDSAQLRLGGRFLSDN